MYSLGHNDSVLAEMPYGPSLVLVRRLALALLAALPLAAASARAATLVDAAGRTVEVPDRAERVFAAGPPAAVALFAVAPGHLLGWVSAPGAEAQAFLDPRYRDLPATGRLTGSSGNVELDEVRELAPDLIVDIGTVDPRYAAIAGTVQGELGVPYVLLDGSLDATPDLLRTLGRLTGAGERAEALAALAERTLADIDAGLAGRSGPPPRVYYGRGDGLTTGKAGSINVESIVRVGAANVAAALGSGGLVAVTPEQLIGWDPDVIVTQEPDFARALLAEPRWQALRAVREHRVHLAPSLPWGWIEGPPGINRLIGLRWLAAVLYPDRFVPPTAEQVSAFYTLAYGATPTAAQLDALLAAQP